MTRIIIATHYKLADGFKSTLDYIAPGVTDVITLSAYIDNVPVEEQVNNLLNNISEDEIVIVFTDMLGGSVNQEFTKKLNHKNLHIITGTNFPVLLTLALKASNGDITESDIREAVNDAKEQLVYVNDAFKNMGSDEDDE